MKPIFGRGPSLQLRLFFAVIVSASLMLADSRLDAFSQVRFLLNSLVAPIQYAADLPRSMFDGFYERFSSRHQLMESNRALKREALTLKSELILLDQYREENQRLRKLLGSSFVRDEKKVVAEVMGVDTSPYRHQVVIDKGRVDGVYEGQPVINEKGIVGQVTFVAAHNSRVLLLIDPNSAIPVQNIRNDIRVVASGNGQTDEIQLEHIATSTDMEVGDMLVTSGLGGVYPEGYPVAYLSHVDKDTRREFASIKASPVVDFNRLRYLLLIWPNEDRQQKVLQANPQQMTEESDHGTE
ncbi:rod shape-determining protein MreC [Vibrio cincinnatiensis]|jgi:rod shape-determining protein MreC|uniref:Cell shape-determining protein MreC n=1 Tax=Vibrio cincinnatiensis DSM 19608 TaxID=1123491 RepID=A0A1T4QG48_VIBCI|nr:rod shape-determining protein MreC [Vibrio cincinnatiensis]MCG3721801.1 rod shape-determining protein MreC [Vibrio cincinnatiensis]MCG3726808.1 rod shape-determining protein MreC [Vibrio cincinnatiensis]MCG3733730.1 rod shape-determining protein MreC [Vibrio cincinnatiensis]MCG3737342.1 rod shape-determining protein MreC [Vibrio cincinnatiensis]MCG3740253.1 rod shape-determining protein MreC [Vibrio cincinnatiensis]